MGLYTTAIVTAFVAFTASCYQDRPAPGGPRPHGMRPPGQTYEADGAKGMPDMRGFQQGAPPSGSAPGGWSKKGPKGSRPEASGSAGSGSADGMPGMDSFDKGMAEMLSGMSMEDMMGKPDAQGAGGAGAGGAGSGGGGTPGAGPYDGLSAEEIMGTVPESEFPEKFKKLQEDRLRQEKDGFETKDDPRPDSTVRASTENVDVHITEQVRRPANPGPPKRKSDGEFAETAADMEDDGHLADYAYVSRITFKSPAHATRALEDINKGSIEFLELAMAQRMGSGGGGLTQGGGEVIDIVCRKDVESEYTTVVFDVREQLSSLGQKPTVHGPVCSAQGNCALIAVFSRYRRQFFSQAWREFENFALKNNMPFSEMVDIIRSDEISLRELAYMVWDGEHRSIKQANVKQLKKDLDLIGKNEDPTTQRMAPPARPRDFRRHEQLMIAREKTLSMVPDAVKEDHPEIWGMSIEQIHEKGWVEAPVKTPTKTAAAEDEVSPKSDSQPVGDQNTSGSDDDGEF